MSVPLGGEHRSELPLIAFTTCEPAALGIALFGFCSPGNPLPALVAWVLSGIGMLASIGHLAKPLRAPRSLANLRSSWLSREILVVAAFWAALTGWAAACLTGAVATAVLCEAAACAIGAVLLYVIARAYRVSPRPAWCGSEGLMELWAGALGTGPAVLLVCSGAASPVAAALAVVSSVIGLALDVASHRRRRQRLAGLAASSDERIPLTLERYARLWPTVRLLWAVEALCVLATTGAALFFAPLACLAVVGQIVVHGLHRNLFYELPVQVRWVARLRK